MALIIETGSIVAGANSYVTVAEARPYVESRGGSFPIEDLDGEYLILKAMDFFESHNERFKGDIVSKAQPLSFPRQNFEAEGWNWSSDEIPRQVKTALLALVFEIAGGADPFNPETVQAPAIKKKVGPIETVYAEPVRVSKVYKNSTSGTLMRLLLKNSGLSMVRV